MDEVHSMVSEQPKKKRTREAKKDEKRKEKKRSSSFQELSPEGGKCYVSSVRFLLPILTVNTVELVLENHYFQLIGYDFMHF